MARQRSLNFGTEQIATIWQQVPEPCRQQTIVLWAQLIAAAAQRRSKRKGVTR